MLLLLTLLLLTLLLLTLNGEMTASQSYDSHQFDGFTDKDNFVLGINSMDMDINEIELKGIPSRLPICSRISSNTATFLYHGGNYSRDFNFLKKSNLNK